MKLHLRQDLHLARKAWHLSMGLLCANIYHNGMSRPNAVSILTPVFLAVVFLEWARLNVPFLNDVAVRLWRPFMRTSEVDRVSGTPWYIAAIAISIAVFPKSIAILTLLYLACGDPIASIFGILYGHKGPRFKDGKSWIGTCAGAAVCILIALIAFRNLPLSWPQYCALSLISGLSGGFAEILPLDVDDNFSIPLVSGFVTWLAFMFFGVSNF